MRRTVLIAESLRAVAREPRRGFGEEGDQNMTVANVAVCRKPTRS
jgi:hypothetical protein